MINSIKEGQYMALLGIINGIGRNIYRKVLYVALIEVLKRALIFG
jgi:hypothetical protein